MSFDVIIETILAVSASLVLGVISNAIYDGIKFVVRKKR